METLPFQVPRAGALFRHAAPRIIEGTVLPLGVFLLGLRLLGVAGAVVAGLGFTYSAIAWRLATRRRVPGILVIGAMTLTAKSVLTLATGSVFLYFLQPTLGTALVATAFLLSVPARRPLAARLARDFCPIPPEMFERAPVQRFFTQITLLWAFTQMANALLTMWLLLSESVGVFVVARTVVSLSLTASAIALSVLWCRRTMHEHVVFACRAANGPKGGGR